MSRFILFLIVATLSVSCRQDVQLSDAYGNFEATATTVSSETAGRLISFSPKEGELLNSGDLVAIVDTTSLHLQRKQIDASIGTLPKKLRNTLADIEVLQNQISNITRERDRVQRLVKNKAATPQQLDDLNGKIEVLKKQIAAVRSQTRIGNSAILAEKEPMIAQKAIINESIRKSYVKNPVKGTVLTTLSEKHEVVGPGSPLYRIADLETMTLRFYVDAVQLQDIKLGQKIFISIDSGQTGMRDVEGTVTWISSQAEFTPKTIQTKEDRVNLVYALKAKVKNSDGSLKIGMPAEVNFTKKQSPSEEQSD